MLSGLKEVVHPELVRFYRPGICRSAPSLPTDPGAGRLGAILQLAPHSMGEIGCVQVKGELGNT